MEFDDFQTETQDKDAQEQKQLEEARAADERQREAKLARQQNFTPRKQLPILTPAERIEIEEMFNLFDTDGSGTMELAEIRILLTALGFQPEEGEVEQMVSEFFNISEEEVEDISLTLDEFLALMTQKLQDRETPDKMLRAFGAFDIDCKGAITLKDIKRVAREIDFQLTGSLY